MVRESLPKEVKFHWRTIGQEGGLGCKYRPSALAHCRRWEGILRGGGSKTGIVTKLKEFILPASKPKDA